MLDLRFKELEQFGEYPAKKTGRGRPRKKIIEKNFGSLVGKNCTALQMAATQIEQLKFYNAYTIEWIAPVRNLQLEKFCKEFVAELRDIINKKSRKYPALNLSGIRTIVPRNVAAGKTLLEIRIVCTTFEGALFIFSHLAHYFYKDKGGYTGTALHLYGVDDNLKRQRRAGSFDLETGGRWSSYFYDNGGYWLVPSVDYARAMLPADYARVTAAAFRNFSPSHLCIYDLTLVKGALGYCERVNDKGEVVINKPRTIYKGFRTAQTFGLLYNVQHRREEMHVAGSPWYYYNW